MMLLGRPAADAGRSSRPRDRTRRSAASTIVWRARMISAATGIGSSARCGVEAWPPRPRTVIRMHVGRGHDRRRAGGGPSPRRVAVSRCGSRTRRSAARIRRRRRRAAPPRASPARRASPPRPAGTSGSRGPAARPAAPGAGGRRRAASPRGCRARRRASRRRSREAKSSPVSSLERQRVHVGAQEDRRARPAALDDRRHGAERHPAPTLEPDLRRAPRRSRPGSPAGPSRSRAGGGSGAGSR